MTSFGIESLFMSIPLDETTHICVNNVFGNKKRVNGLLRKDFKKFLDKLFIKRKRVIDSSA